MLHLVQTRHLASLVLLQLFTIYNVNKVICQGVESSVIVRDPSGKIAGPQIALSDTVLEDGQNLNYTCIENSAYEDNRLSRLYEDGRMQEIGKVQTTSLCNYEVDPFFVCTILKGKATWKKEYGGKYGCSAAPDDWYYIHWINPVMHVSDNHDLLSHQYGSTIDLPCSVEMTPTDISYDGIFQVSWQWLSRKTGNAWTHLKLSNTVTSRIAPRGANATLTIRNFNPIQHGGEYRCIGAVLRYDKVLTSERFSIKSRPRATLKNNKRINFLFGVDETNVRFTCEALSYPFPDKIEFKLQAAVLDEKTKGVTLYEADIVSVNKRFHKAVFTVNNMTEVFLNDSLLECRVFRSDGKFSVSQRRIILVDTKKPTTLTRGTTNRITTTKTIATERTTYESISVAISTSEPIEGGIMPWVVITASAATAVGILLVLTALLLRK